MRFACLHARGDDGFDVEIGAHGLQSPLLGEIIEEACQWLMRSGVGGFSNVYVVDLCTLEEQMPAVPDNRMVELKVKLTVMRARAHQEF